VQRVSRAAVEVDGRCVGEIGAGLLVLLGVEQGDTETELEWCAQKTAGLRIFPDDEEKMNRSVLEAGGGVLVISQFTLLADVQHGRRPSFVSAAPPEIANPMYERFVDKLRALGLTVATGIFAAKMSVSLVNEGPVTIIIERPPGDAKPVE
jgi:D-aminoacyl-tRNA deacylase